MVGNWGMSGLHLLLVGIICTCMVKHRLCVAARAALCAQQRLYQQLVAVAAAWAMMKHFPCRGVGLSVGKD